MMLMELGSASGAGGGVLLQEAVGSGSLSHAPSAVSTSTGGGRIRFVRLLRRRGETYGFSLRGGKEHGTGFFISHVEPGSEAYHNGLRAGDQVLRVNNLCVEQAVHREVAAMVQAKNSVILKVRSTGIIPIKENRGDPLTWMVVDDDEEMSDNGTETYSHSLPSTSMPETDTDSFQQSPTTNSESFHQSQSSTSTSTSDSHARVYITYNVKTGLGCSICKGPPEKNGIFVQSVRAGGVAKEAGLRPGDQILACNDVSFQHLEFAEAVYVLKSSTHLTLDVLRGAGLDLVAGESSGYNSSASSVAGDQTPPSAASSGSSDTSHKDSHRRSNSHDSVASRLSAVSRHLTLDRSRGWREIEAEWANAEAEQKRQQLQQNQKNLKTRAQRDAAMRSASRSVGTSRSMSNLLVQEEDEEEETTAFRDTPFTTTTLQRNKPVGYKSPLRSAVSTSDLRSDHKIALVTSADPHVNNIVVTQGPKDERDAVSRLEQLSLPSTDSRNSTISSSASQVTVRSSLGDLRYGTQDSKASMNPQVEMQLRELREEQRRLQLEADRLAEDRRRFEEERRGLLRTQSVPLSPTFSPTLPLLISCSTPPSSLSQPPPSPTPSTASGRHTTRVVIKSAPPPPPPRHKKTSLSSTLTRRGHHHRPPSPPASPSHSSSSSGVGSSCGSGGPPPRRCKSIGSLSASSGESSLWEESSTHPSAHQFTSTPISHKAHYSSSFRPSMPPPPTPPKPTSSSSITSSPQAAGGVPPPPPPPPQGPPAAATPSLANALLREIEKRGEQQEVIGTQDTTDTSARTQKLEDKIDAYKKERSNAAPVDTRKARHDQLMEEFKVAHKRMFKDPLDGKEQTSTAVNTSQIFSKANLKPVTPKTSQSEQTTPIVSPTVSKIINNTKNVKVEQTTPVVSKIINNSKIAKTPLTATKVVNQVVVNGENRSTEKLFNSRIVKGSSANKTSNEKETIIITSADTKVTIGNNTKPVLKKSKDITASNINSKNIISNGTESTPSVLKLSQQWNERSGGTNISVSSIKASTRPGVTSTSSSVLPGSTTVEMNEFKPSISLQPAKAKTPNTYFDVKPKVNDNKSKPLVSINVYPSAMQRPSPNKMDFLPTPSHTTDIKTNGNVSNVPNKQSLQNELTSTLNRSPLRQRLIPQDLPEDPPSSTGTSATNGNILYLYSTSAIYDTNDNIPFNNNYDSSVTSSTTLSSKYSGLGTDISSVTFINDVEESFREGYRDSPTDALAESPPAGILKQAPRPTQHRPLHKSISFGDVTTVGDDELTS